MFRVSLWEPWSRSGVAKSGQSTDSTGTEGPLWGPSRAPLYRGQRSLQRPGRQQWTFSSRGGCSRGRRGGGGCWGEEGLLGEEELTGARDEGPTSSEQQPGDWPCVHPHSHTHLPQQPAHLLQRWAQEEDVVPGQNQGWDLGEPTAWWNSVLVGLSGGGRRWRRGIRYHDLPQGIHGNVQVLHSLPLPTVDLSPEFLLFLRAQLPLRFCRFLATLEAEHGFRV